MAVSFQGWSDLVNSDEHLTLLRQQLNDILHKHTKSVTVTHLTLGMEKPELRLTALVPTPSARQPPLSSTQLSETPTAAPSTTSSAAATTSSRMPAVLETMDSSVEFAYCGTAAITFRLLDKELNCLESERKHARVGLRARQLMGMADSDHSIRAPVSITLSGFDVSGVVDVKADKETVCISVGGRGGGSEVVHNIDIRSSFDGSPAGVAVATGLKAQIAQAVDRLASNPVTITLRRPQE